MLNAKLILEQQYLEMRWRCLSLAADLDRIERSEGGLETMKSDSRLAQLRKAMQILLSPEGSRAEKVQMLLSDASPPPER